MNSERIYSLDQLILENKVELGRGAIISKKDIARDPGDYPIYSSAREKNGTFGFYGKYMFDEEMITWSVDGGGRLFYRPKHKFSVTNVGGILRILDKDFIDCKYLYYALTFLHSKINFDWVYKAHPSVIRKVYDQIPVPTISQQREIVRKLDNSFANISELKRLTEQHLEFNREISEAVYDNLTNASMSEDDLLPLSDLGVWTTGSTPSTTNHAYWGDDMPFVTPADLGVRGELRRIKRKISNLGAAKVRIIEPPSIVLVCIGASLGKVALANHIITTNQQINSLQPNLTKLDPEFGMYFFSSKPIQKELWGASNGTTLPLLTKTALQNIVVRVPKIQYQLDAVKRIKKFEFLSKQREANYTQKLKLLTELQSTLLNEHFGTKYLGEVA